MTMAATCDGADGLGQSSAGLIASVEVFDDLTTARAAWEWLEASDSIVTPFQRFQFLSAWHAHVGVRQRVQPFIVVCRDHAGVPVMLLPLGLRRENGTRIARFLGGNHATFNMPLMTRASAAALSQRDVELLLAGLRRMPDGPDLIELSRLPLRWDGAANPLAKRAALPSINPCPLLELAPGAASNDNVSASMRKRLRKKERKLQNAPGYRFVVATTPAEIERILGAFLKYKPGRMAAKGLPDFLAAPGTRDFLAAACSNDADRDPGLVLHALVCDEEVIAVFGGVGDGKRMSLIINTYTMSERARYSPGLILLRSIIDHYAAEGYRAIDLGTGSADFKSLFCKADEPLVDAFLPLTAKGAVMSRALAVVHRAKRMVKRSETMTRAAHALRERLSAAATGGSSDHAQREKTEA